jgi:hypothetical protein
VDFFTRFPSEVVFVIEATGEIADGYFGIRLVERNQRDQQDQSVVLDMATYG